MVRFLEYMGRCGVRGGVSQVAGPRSATTVEAREDAGTGLRDSRISRRYEWLDDYDSWNKPD